ncbi:MAG: serine hydrolase domain-containing protein [Pseudomonadota bacterium]
MTRKRSASFAVALLSAVFVFGHPASAQETYAGAGRNDDPGSVREALTLDQLTGDARLDPVHYGNFLPVGPTAPAKAGWSGTLTIPAFELYAQSATGLGASRQRVGFPGLEVDLFAQGGVLLLLDHDRFLSSPDAGWEVILSAGQAWTEPADADWSRASFPVTLVRKGGSTTFNGAATLAYRGDQVSRLFLQFGQEGIPTGGKHNLWGEVPVSFEARDHATGPEVLAQFQAARALDFPEQGWQALLARADRDLPAFDNPLVRSNVTVSGLLVDGTVYRTDCHTRFGPYPFCDRLRHPVFSVSKSLGAATAMLRLAEKYGVDVFETRLLDHLPLEPLHAGWDEVTFADALNMATGIGDLTPQRVAHYVDTDGTFLESEIWRAPTVQDKLRLVAAYRDYPWGPGEVLRYKSSETMLLAIAMDRFIRAREGPDYGLWDMMTREVFAPLGVPPIPTRMAWDADMHADIPRFDGGMFPTYQEVLKLASLMADGGVYDGVQILHPDLTRAAMSTDTTRGLPSGWHYAEGGEATYDMSFWLAPHQTGRICNLRVPLMSGFGGNYVAIMPNQTIGFRFTDNPDNAPGTYDSFGMRQVSDIVQPFCE